MTDPRKLPPAGHPTKPASGAKTPQAQGPATQPTQRLRPPLPTLLELGQESATQTLRPPGAVPPAPRGVPGSTPFNLRMEDVFDPSTPQIPREPALPAEAAPAREAAPAPAEANLRAPAVPPAPAEPPPAVPSLITARAPTQARAPSPPASPAVRSQAPSAVPPSTAAQIIEVFRRPKTLALLALAGACGGILALTWPREEEPAPRGSASATIVEHAAPRVVSACLSRGVHQKLAQSVDLSVPVIALNGASEKPTQSASHHGAESQRLLLGFAAGATEAVGLTVDPLTLDAAQAFSEKGEAKLSSVVPLPGGKGKAPAFVTSRIDGESLGGSALQLGGGLTRIVSTKRGVEAGQGASTAVLWPELSGAETTPPRAEVLGDGGAALVLRRGGRSGEVVVGLLGRDGRAAGQMTKITTDAHEFGTPAVAASDREILVSFATRKTPTAPWRIELARAPLGQRPAASRAFVPADLPEKNNMISPTAAALPGGGWLLQWTEGGAEGKYRVRLQTLDATLAPVGAPITVGPDGANAGQGAAWAGMGIDTISGLRAVTKRAVSFYVVRTGQGSELWATALECR